MYQSLLYCDWQHIEADKESESSKMEECAEEQLVAGKSAVAVNNFITLLKCCKS